MSLIEINKTELPTKDWKVFKDGSYQGTYLGWSMWTRQLAPDQPGFPEPWVLYVTDEGELEAQAIYGVTLRCM